MSTLFWVSTVHSDQRHLQGNTLDIIGAWTTLTFIGAADCEISCLLRLRVRWITSMVSVVMILRVWALYRGLKLVLGVLLTVYAMEIIPYLIVCIMVSNERNLGM